jgi:hypothetical protein
VAALDAQLLPREPVTTRIGECVQDRLVDVERGWIENHRLGLPGKHSKRLPVQP